jgi:hypothetical protein
LLMLNLPGRAVTRATVHDDLLARELCCCAALMCCAAI